MIYFYYGEDSFRAKETIDLLKNKFIELYDPSGHNIERIDGDDFSLEKFNTAVSASGFLAPKKLIIIRNIFSSKNFKDIQDSIIDFLKTQKNTKEENYLVFWHEGKPRSTMKLYKHLHKICKKNCCVNFENLKGAQIISWIQSHASKRGARIEHSAAELLNSAIGNDTWNLSNEINKLTSATNGKEITVDDVERITNARISDIIFPFVDALGGKDTKQALKLLEDAFQDELENIYLLAMIIRQFRLIIRAKELQKTTRNSYAIAQKIGLPQFIANKIVSQCGNYTSRELAHVYNNLQSIDRILKSDPAKGRVALTVFVTTVTTTSS